MSILFTAIFTAGRVRNCVFSALIFLHVIIHFILFCETKDIRLCHRMSPINLWNRASSSAPYFTAFHIDMTVLFHHGNYYLLPGCLHPFLLNHKLSLDKTECMGLRLLPSPGCFCPSTFVWNLGLNTISRGYLISTFYALSQLLYFTGRSGVCNWLFSCCLAPWINYSPPVVIPLFGNIVLNDNWFVGLRKSGVFFCYF